VPRGKQPEGTEEVSQDEDRGLTAVEGVLPTLVRDVATSLGQQSLCRSGVDT
jgi:hypothetical protein